MGDEVEVIFGVQTSWVHRTLVRTRFGFYFTVSDDFFFFSKAASVGGRNSSCSVSY